MNLTNKATMTSLEIVQVINSMRGEGESELRHDNFMVKVPKVLGELAAPKFLGMAFWIVNGAKRERAIYNLPKREAILMVGSYSYAVQAAIYDRMTELELQLGSVKINATEKVTGLLTIASALADMLRVSESGRIAMARTVLASHAPDAVMLLPAYAVDAPSGHIGSESSHVSHSLSDLLKQFNIDGSAYAWNKRLNELGMLKKESYGEGKHYWSITNKGLKYGKNLTSDKAQKTTQPYWYDCKFLELIDLYKGV